MSGRRVFAMFVASVKMIVRDRTALFFSLAFPIVFMTLFGLIFGNASSSRPDLDVVGTGPLVTALQHSNAVKLHVQPDATTALKRVHDGDETGALIVTGGKAHLYFQASSTVQGPILRAIVQGVADNLNIRASQRPPLVRVTTSSIEDRNLSYIDYLVPGLLAMAISQSAVFGIAFALVAFRAKGILRRLRLTPMPLGEFAAARVLMALCLALAQAVVLLAVGHFAFGVTIAGNLLSLLPLIVLGALCFIAIGLLVGSIAKTEDAAAAMANIVTLPMTFLAGVFFPLDSAPGVVQAVSKVLPLTYLANGLRGVAVRDHSFAWTLPKLGVLAAFAVVIVAVSLRSFRWTSL
ncbi:MAG: type transport system permease protein [Gaiellales bacterium]|jgi:ABC-2 type transport system permease protein|nr:type transport system permease protein [Gaiellales bacterium]